MVNDPAVAGIRYGSRGAGQQDTGPVVLGVAESAAGAFDVLDAGVRCLDAGIREHQTHGRGFRNADLPDPYPADQRRENRSVNTRHCRVIHHEPRRASLASGFHGGVVPTGGRLQKGAPDLE